MVNAQEWLNENYPEEGRSEITSLDISDNDLEGELDLSDFTSLRHLFCEQNKLTNLKLPTETINSVEANNNNLKDLSIFSECVNLKKIVVSNDDFSGSLKPLENLVNLSQLNINGTNIDSGLEFLPNSIEKFWSSKPLAEKVHLEIIDDHGLIKNFPQKLKEYKERQGSQIQVNTK